MLSEVFVSLGCAPRSHNLRYGAVRAAEMLPTRSIDVLNLTDETYPGGSHRLVSGVEIVNAETNYWAGYEERMESITETIELQN